MEKQVSRLKDSQTELTAGTPWRLEVHGDAVRADRLLEMENLPVPPAPGLPALFTTGLARLQSGDRVAIMGRNGGGNRRCCACYGDKCSNRLAKPGCVYILDYIRVITIKPCINWRMRPACWRRWSP